MRARFLFCAVAAGSFGAATARAAAQPDSAAAQHAWTTNGEMLTFFDAATKMAAHGLAAPSLGEIVQRSLRLLAADLDPYSYYLSAEEYARYRDAQRPEYGGVGMELAADRRSGLRCLPYPDSPAAAAGIRDGDLLVAVDGTPVDGRQLMEIGWRIRGAPGSVVTLTVQTADESPREVPVARAQVRAPTVAAQPADELRRLRIYRFGPTTAAELLALLRDASTTETVVLDLRGNPGGSLYDAVDAARLFLPTGAAVTAIRDRNTTRTHTAQGPPKIPDTPLILLQDERTASAAELFIAALTGNRRAVSAGSPTYGKGTTQRVIELIDGSALVLTDAHFLQPDQSPIPPGGLPPTLPVDPDRATAAALMQAYQALAPVGGPAVP